MADELFGCVSSIVYNRDAYYILNFSAVGHRAVKAKGYFHGLVTVRAGVPFKLMGDWTTHVKYGKGFTIRNWEPYADSLEGVTEFLASCIPGFSDYFLIDALVKRYGLNLFDKLTNAASEIQAQPLEGVPEAVLSEGLLGWSTALAYRDAALLLGSSGLSASDIQAVMVKFGGETGKVVRSNPYRLLEIAGFAFAKVDKLALYLGVKSSDPRRVQGAVLWALQYSSQQGHLYMPRGDLWRAVKELQSKELAHPIPLGPDAGAACDQAAKDLLGQKSVVLDVKAGLYLPDLFKYERDASKGLVTLLQTPTPEWNIGEFLGEYEKAHQITLSEAQRTAVELFSKHRVLVVTGLPGTGKTSVLRAIVRLAEESRMQFHLMAPTGIAAKRLASVTGHPASTVHRALGYDGDSWRSHENNRLITDAVILDEASMVDQELFYRLVTSLRPDTKLVLVGDDAQLPSVGPGNVLRQLLDCPAIPKVRLTEIFRQSVKGEIVTSSHQINSGKMPELDTPKESEFRFVRLGDEERIVRLIVEMAVRLKAAHANFQVLSPKYDGVVGVNNLNEALREALNPSGPMEWIRGNQRFREGDRLMVVQNDYKMGVYNGDVGKLTGVSQGRKGGGLVVKIHGAGEGSMDTDVFFGESEAENKLRLAYAITAHKCQGSEFDTIIMPVVKSQGRMLQRNLLYTAVTRARKRVWLIGEEVALQKAIDNNKVIQRNTMLANSVLALLEAGVAPP